MVKYTYQKFRKVMTGMDEMISKNIKSKNRVDLQCFCETFIELVKDQRADIRQWNEKEQSFEMDLENICKKIYIETRNKKTNWTKINNELNNFNKCWKKMQLYEKNK